MQWQPNLRDAYAKASVSQIPRILTNMDRNPLSKTFGCLHRDYWMDKTSDFPDAVRQYGVHALALVYKHDLPGNTYQGQPRIRDWAIAGMSYWASVQHGDGSFDEFYPYERGWGGPTAFSSYAVAESLLLLGEEAPGPKRTRIQEALMKAAGFLVRGESEGDSLANHHAMACLALAKIQSVTGNKELGEGVNRAIDTFLTYHSPGEGWSREYDGADPGYQSATVSFLAKLDSIRPDPRVRAALEKSVEFCSYFVYPDGSYGGNVGSRNTAHFYTAGFELLAESVPLAAAIAEKALEGLSRNRLVPPEVMADRYHVDRVAEYLEAYLAYRRPSERLPLPCEKKDINRYFPEAKVSVISTERLYIVANLAKGGVTKVYNRQSCSPLLSDSGVVAQLRSSGSVTSQWIGSDYVPRHGQSGWSVTGSLHRLPKNRLFTPLSNILFRAVLISCGWLPGAAHFIKRCIRRMLIVGERPTGWSFERRLTIDDQGVTLTTTLKAGRRDEISSVMIGGDPCLRYVPQSRYFQPHELHSDPYHLEDNDLARIREGLTLTVRLDAVTGAVERTLSQMPNGAPGV